MEMVIAISYREVGGGGIKILTYMSQKLNVAASRKMLDARSIPGRQIPPFTEGK